MARKSRSKSAGKPKRESGGRRAAKAKQAAREAARTRDAGGDWRAAWKEQLDELGERPETSEAAHLWLGRRAILIVDATLRDTAMPPEQMRRDAMKQIEQASKVLEPAKLAEQLAELERALQESEDARQESPREGGGSPAEAPLS